MKRTLTAAAAVLVGGAGAVGFAATANAAETPQLPAELPTDNNLAQTTYHFAGTVHSAEQTVGDVVPLENAPAVRGSTSPLGNVTGVIDDSPVGDQLGALPVGEVLPAGQTLPAPKSGGDLLPPALGGQTLPAPLPANEPQTKPGTLPSQQQDLQPPNLDLVGNVLNLVTTESPLGGPQLSAAKSADPIGLVGAGGDPVSGLTGPESPVAGLADNMPLAKAAPADPLAPLENVNDLLTHGPLGGTHQLGG